MRFKSQYKHPCTKYIWYAHVFVQMTLLSTNATVKITVFSVRSPGRRWEMQDRQLVEDHHPNRANTPVGFQGFLLKKITCPFRAKPLQNNKEVQLFWKETMFEGKRKCWRNQEIKLIYLILSRTKWWDSTKVPTIWWLCVCSLLMFIVDIWCDVHMVWVFFLGFQNRGLRIAIHRKWGSWLFQPILWAKTSLMTNWELLMAMVHQATFTNWPSAGTCFWNVVIR